MSLIVRNILEHMLDDASDIVRFVNEIGSIVAMRESKLYK